FYSGVVAVSHDGRLLAGADVRQGPVVWDTKQGRVTRVLPFAGFPPVAFAPDGRSLVSLRPVLQRWDAFEDNKLGGGRIEDGPTEEVRQLSWSPDGRTLAARAGYGGALYLWDTS